MYIGNRYEFRTEDIDQGTNEQYWEGKKVDVYYNPDDPSIAVLVPGNSLTLILIQDFIL